MSSTVSTTGGRGPTTEDGRRVPSKWVRVYSSRPAFSLPMEATGEHRASAGLGPVTARVGDSMARDPSLDGPRTGPRTCRMKLKRWIPGATTFASAGIFWALTVERIVLEAWPTWLLASVATILTTLGILIMRRDQKLTERRNANKQALFDHVSPKIEAWLPGSGPPHDTPKNVPSLLDPDFTSKTRE